MTNKVVKYKASHARKVRGTDVKKGQTLYAVQNKINGLFFIWSYTSKEQAEAIAAKVGIDGVADEMANWRADISACIPSDTTKQVGIV